MAKWKRPITTTEGHALIAKARAGKRIKYTKVVAGDGERSGSGDDYDKIINPVQTADIKSVEPVGTNTVLIKSILSNKELTTGYFIREIGIFAVSEDEPNNEVLHSLVVAEDGKADYWPEFEAVELRIPINMSIATGDSENVTAEIINSYGAYEIGYNNGKSGLEAVNVQEALDELSEKPSIVVIPKGGDIPISEREEGAFYLKVTDEQSATGAGEAGIVVANAIISDTEPDDKSVLWFDIN